jgi:catechol 2,3-dioxygenase-like lactoylglutathione lyase family enzyme
VKRIIDYARLATEHAVTDATWDRFVRASLIDLWVSDYEAATDWNTEILEIEQGELTFLFDAGPTLIGDRRGHGDDRAVAVWGRSTSPVGGRDRARIAGSLPNPLHWSRRHRDRGHFVAHATGGGLDLNLFPQALGLNRGRTGQGRRWQEMERYAAGNPRTPLFVRPIYDTDTWTPTELDHAILTRDGLRFERFSNRPGT